MSKHLADSEIMRQINHRVMNWRVTDDTNYNDEQCLDDIEDLLARRAEPFTRPTKGSRFGPGIAILLVVMLALVETIILHQTGIIHY